MSTTTAKPAVGVIGLGDQGLPMATAIAQVGYHLHVWARHPGSLDAPGSVALCVSTDEDVMQIVTGLLDGRSPGSVIVNHGTGTPRNAVRLTETCTRIGVNVLDAPVSGGRPAAQVRMLTTMVGGPRRNAVNRSSARSLAMSSTWW